MPDLDHLVGELSQNMSVEELLQSKIFAIKDLRERDVLLLKKAFNIKTVKELAELKFALWAQNFSRLAESGKPVDMAQFEHQLIKAYESLSIEQILDAPVYALQGVSENDAKLLKLAFDVDTVRDLATAPAIIKAQEIAAYLKKKQSKIVKVILIYGILVLIIILAILFI